MFINKFAFFAAGVGAALSFAQVAQADVVVLDFNGVANPSNSTSIGGFYNGGTSGDGNTGTNYGVTFSDNALAINGYNGSGEPDPGILYFLSGDNVFINYAAGFDTGFSFFYASNSSNGLVSVYDGLDGTGSLLASFALANNYSSACGYCNWDPIGVGFGGIAKSISFAGAADYIAFDRVTFGAAEPQGPTVPEPATWAMLISGFALAGGLMRRRSTAVAFA